MIRIRALKGVGTEGEDEWLINPKEVSAVKIVEPSYGYPYRVILYLRGTPLNYSGLIITDPPSIDRILDLEGYNS